MGTGTPLQSLRVPVPLAPRIPGVGKQSDFAHDAEKILGSAVCQMAIDDARKLLTLGQQGQQIRTNPAARSTSLLK